MNITSRTGLPTREFNVEGVTSYVYGFGPPVAPGKDGWGGYAGVKGGGGRRKGCNRTEQEEGLSNTPVFGHLRGIVRIQTRESIVRCQV